VSTNYRKNIDCCKLSSRWRQEHQCWLSLLTFQCQVKVGTNRLEHIYHLSVGVLWFIHVGSAFHHGQQRYQASFQASWFWYLKSSIHTNAQQKSDVASTYATAHHSLQNPALDLFPYSFVEEGLTESVHVRPQRVNHWSSDVKSIINNTLYIYTRIIMYLCKVCSVRICIKWYDIRHILKISHGLGWWRWSHHPLAPRATFQERLKVDDGALAEVLREEGGDEAEALKEAAKEAGSPKWSLASSKIPKRESLSLKRFQTWSFLQDYDPKTWVTWILFRYIRYNIYNLRNKDAHA